MSLKFTAEAGPLRDLVDFVKSGLGTGKDLARQVVRFDLEGTQLGLVAADGDIYAWGGTVVDAPAGQAGSFAVMGRRLIGLVTQLSPDRFEFEVDDENVRVSAGTAVVNFERYAPDLLEHTAAAQNEIRGIAPRPPADEIPRSVLAEALSIAATAAARSTGKIELSHVELRERRLLASDGRRICVVESGHFPEDGVLKIPVSAIDRTAAALKALDKGAGATPYEGAGFYYLAATNRVLAFRKTANEFPQVEKQLAADYGVDALVVNRDALQAAMRDVELGLASDRAEIGFKTEGAGGALTAQNSLGRESRIPFEIAGREGDNGGPIEFPISLDHLRSAVGSMSAEAVRLEAIPAHKMVRLTDSGDARTVIAMLPFRKATDGQQPSTEEGESTGQEAAAPAESPEGDDSGAHESGVVL